MLRTTVDAYASGSAMQKARAALWIEEALTRPLRPADLRNEHWTIAETLFALRYVQSVIDAEIQQPTAGVGWRVAPRKRSRKSPKSRSLRSTLRRKRLARLGGYVIHAVLGEPQRARARR